MNKYEFGQDVQKVLKKFGNSNLNYWFFHILFFTNLKTVLQMFSALCSMSKIFEKMKVNHGIEVFQFSIERVLKKYGKCFLKICGNPEW